MVGTKASLRMMTSLINGNEVTGAEADMWMTSLAFIKNPTKDMLLELKVNSSIAYYYNIICPCVLLRYTDSDCLFGIFKLFL
jgi:hypothetical protein